MTGEAATAQLTKMGCQTPIFMLTANESWAKKDVAVAGAMGVLNKPLTIPNLLCAYLRSLRKQPGMQPEKTECTKGIAPGAVEPEPQHAQTQRVYEINPQIEKWTKEQVCLWLAELGKAYETYQPAFVHHGINGKMLLLLSKDEHFHDLGVTIPLHVLKIKLAIAILKKKITKTCLFK